METNSQQRPVNVRKRSVMELVSREVGEMYASPLVDRLKGSTEGTTIGNTTVLLAQMSGFCYGVRRAVDLAHATCLVFPERRKFLIGEMIHNPEVNQNLRDLGIVTLPWKEMTQQYEELTSEDVVIIPAFGVPVTFMEKLHEKGVSVVDTTCGDVMTVWRRVKANAKEGITSIIHGKIEHEETLATVSRAKGAGGNGHYVVVRDEHEANFLAACIRGGVTDEDFFEKFSGACSGGLEPRVALRRIGMANQTTMYRKETERLQEILLHAVIDRDGHNERFHIYNTICNATQVRQDSLKTLIGQDIDVLFVVGGFNSSNTTHLVEVGQRHVPTFFIRNAEAIESFEEIWHYDIEKHKVDRGELSELFSQDSAVRIGITAGASCPNHLLEQTLVKIFQLRGVSAEVLAKI